MTLFQVTHQIKELQRYSWLEISLAFYLNIEHFRLRVLYQSDLSIYLSIYLAETVKRNFTEFIFFLRLKTVNTFLDHCYSGF